MPVRFFFSDELMKSGYVKSGVLEVFCGPMKSGKSRALLSVADKLVYVNGCRFVFVKPIVDTRDENVVSRYGDTDFDCIRVDEKNPSDILDFVNTDYDAILIDEVHFFDKCIFDVVDELLRRGFYVVCAGLDLDYRGEPFGAMPYLLALADEVYKLKAVCEYPSCSAIANRTQRLLFGAPAPYDAPTILIGDEEEGYCVRCLRHHEIEKNRD